jgi:DNA gyrase subunit A
MPRKKKQPDLPKSEDLDKNAHILGAGEVNEQKITDTLETNYMPYAVSVIMSRAIPEIDGFKPSHRKLLYTMYLMGLLKGQKIKSANIVGRTMQLNPHGDAAIYETMVRMTRGNETLLHPYIDSKGNFGKAYSKNMAYAASRYTEAKLDPICEELFKDIDKDAVDMVPNYDNSMLEPTLFPVTFPTILVNSNMGIAVGMASNICSFNLREICDTTINLIKEPDFDISQTLLAPDFSGGAQIIYDKKTIDDVYKTGRGQIKLRAKYSYDKKSNCIDIKEIPATTTSEQIIDKVIELVKQGKLKEISDIRDETDKTGLKITIDLKRGTDHEKLMKKLFRSTPLEDTFACNFNILVGGVPKVMGIREILDEWLGFRRECIKRRTVFELNKASDRLHLLEGLEKILLDIDKAVKIIRNTEEESEVVPNLMIGFGIDEKQADYVAEIKLRHLNREYILNRTKDIEDLKKQIDDLNDIIKKKSRIDGIIISELKNVSKKYGKDRKTEIVFDTDDEDISVEREIPDYPVNLFFTKDGYFKKITPQSLRMSGAHKLKDGDFIVKSAETTNNTDIIVITDKYQAYKTNASEFEDTKTSVLGDFLPSVLEFEEDEKPTAYIITKDYSGYILYFFENGKVAKVELSSFATKTNRKKLLNAVSDKSVLVKGIQINEDKDILVESSSGRLLLFNSAQIASKSTKNTQGVQVMTLKKGHKLINAELYQDGMFVKPSRYRPKNIPSSGMLRSADDAGKQIEFNL